MRKSPKVLIADSDSFMQRVYANRLMSHGYEILSAHSVEDALLMTKKHKPDAILCDSNAFEGNGLHLIKHVSQNTPVLCLSNSWDEKHKQEVLAAGANIFGIKSHLTPIEVAAHIDSLIA